MPLEIAETLDRQGRQINVVAISGLADADYSGYPVTSVGILRIAGLLSALRARGARDMIIAGHARRPDLRSRDIDWGFFRHFFTILSLMRGGDDRVLRGIAQFFERNGMTLKGIPEVAPALLTPAAVLAGTVSPSNRAVANEGLKLVHQLGPFDVGQAAILDASGVIAIEGAEGTNGLIARTPGPIRHNDDGLVLIKAAKPQQDLRFDLPTIGPETIAHCAGAGIGTIALEAGRSLILSRAETLEQASAAGITVVGVEPEPATHAPRATQRARPMTCRLRNHTRTAANPHLVKDASMGLEFLSTVIDRGVRAAVVARENILAIALNEPISDFIQRTERLGQWGDRRQKTKRNRVLVLSAMPTQETQLPSLLRQTKLAGIAVLDTSSNPAALDQLVEEADAKTLFVLSPE